jgi:hypothetical protein
VLVKSKKPKATSWLPLAEWERCAWLSLGGGDKLLTILRPNLYLGYGTVLTDAPLPNNPDGRFPALPDERSHGAMHAGSRFAVVSA